MLILAMNEAMWNHPPIARNISRLRQDGFYAVEPMMGSEVTNKGETSRVYGGPGLGRLDLRALRASVLNIHQGHALPETQPR